MRMSCNGCRVLRKGCSEDCSIRPCLQWIKNPESQANATVFLAKFYGRAGLINLINAGPDHLRPAIFRSLLYESCGRIVNPIYGSVGLLWSGNWQLCQAAVDAVLKGDCILQISSDTAANHPLPPLHKAMVSSYDIRHISTDDPATSAAAHLPWGASAATSRAANDLHRINKASRNRFKRSAIHTTGIPGGSAWNEPRPGSPEPEPAGCPRSSPVCDNLHWRQCYAVETRQAPSHESSACQASELYSAGRAAVVRVCSMTTLRDSDSRENESDASMVASHGADLGKANGQTAEDRDVELELTLGLEPVHPSPTPRSSGHIRSGHSPRWGAIRPTGAQLPPYRCDRMTMDDWAPGTARVNLRLDLPA